MSIEAETGGTEDKSVGAGAVVDESVEAGVGAGPGEDGATEATGFDKGMRQRTMLQSSHLVVNPVAPQR